MNYEQVIGIPCSVPRSKLVIDWSAIVFFCGLLVSLAVIIARDPASAPIEYLLLLFALFPVWISVRLLRSHLRAGQIIVREQGVEIAKRDNKVLINWETVKQVREKPFYDGGLILLTEKDERAFIPTEVTIPAGVTNYKAIRSFVAGKVSQRTGGTSHTAYFERAPDEGHGTGSYSQPRGPCRVQSRCPCRQDLPAFASP